MRRESESLGDNDGLSTTPDRPSNWAGNESKKDESPGAYRTPLKRLYVLRYTIDIGIMIIVIINTDCIRVYLEETLSGWVDKEWPLKIWRNQYRVIRR